MMQSLPSQNAFTTSGGNFRGCCINIISLMSVSHIIKNDGSENAKEKEVEMTGGMIDGLKVFKWSDQRLWDSW